MNFDLCYLNHVTVTSVFMQTEVLNFIFIVYMTQIIERDWKINDEVSWPTETSLCIIEKYD